MHQTLAAVIGASLIACTPAAAAVTGPKAATAETRATVSGDYRLGTIGWIEIQALRALVRMP